MTAELRDEVRADVEVDGFVRVATTCATASRAVSERWIDYLVQRAPYRAEVFVELKHLVDEQLVLERDGEQHGQTVRGAHV